MDTVTQITLGAAVGEAVAGRQAGAKAPAWGAALGLLPDLDVLANPFLTEVQALTFHRSFSHSLLFAIVATVGIAVGLARLHRDTSVSLSRWAALVGMALFTHIGLDCLTTYGTQIFWPFSRTPVLFGTIFVIDPLYTIPLAAGLLVSFRWAPSRRARRWANSAGLALSSAYLLFCILNKQHVYRVFETALTDQERPVERMLTMPTPFNNLLWRGIAETPSGYYVGLYSLLDEDRSIDFRYVPKQHALLGDARDSPEVQRLRWFSRGYLAVQRGPDESLLISDLRFGRNDLGLTSEGTYLFTFRLVQTTDGTVAGLRRADPQVRLTGSLLQRFLARIRGQKAVSPPPPGHADATTQ